MRKFLRSRVLGFLLGLVAGFPVLLYAGVTLTSSGSAITSGTTQILGGLDKSVCFVNGTAINCADADFNWDLTNNRLGIGRVAAVANLEITNGVVAQSSIRLYDNTTLVGEFIDNGGWRVNDGVLATPSYSFLSDTDSGMFFASDSGAIVVRLVANGNSYLAVSNNVGAIVGGNLGFIDSNINASVTGSDTRLGRHSAGILAVRATNATNINYLLGGGASVASATAMPVPTGNVFHVTGTTNITSITSTNFATGAVITLIFDGILTFTDGSNLKLAGNFVTTADDTITLAYDGTNWYEIARAVN